MQVVFHEYFYHCLKTFIVRKGKVVNITHCGLFLENSTVVDNDPKITIPHCLKCLNHLMGD